MGAQSYFLVAQTDAETFAEVTGLVQGRHDSTGFVMHGAAHARGGPGGLYPRAQGRAIAEALGKAGISYGITGANSVKQGLRSLGILARAASGVQAGVSR